MNLDGGGGGGGGGTPGGGGSSWSSATAAAVTTSLYEDTLLDESLYSGDPSLLVKTVGTTTANDASSANDIQVLSFCFLGCESSYPYGPMPHTAQLVLDSLSQAVVAAAVPPTEKNQNQQTSSQSESASAASSSRSWMLRMKLYNVQNEEYPASRQEWDSYHGIILPGSYSSAYNPLKEAWMEKLYTVIQEEIVAHKRPTLGICFGHQVLAHSFGVAVAVSDNNNNKGHPGTLQDVKSTRGRGLACKLASDTNRAGRYTMTTTPSGRAIFGQSQIDLFYTHGDHVAQLPDTAVSLGGSQDGKVPILAAAYFGSKEEAVQFRFQQCGTELEEASTQMTTSHDQKIMPIRPFAITFQAHPEYTSSQDLGLWRTLEMLLDLMMTKQHISKEHRIQAGKDAQESFYRVQRDAVQALVRTGRCLGWWS
jgi:GMP synthase-like glutamine amidotransferase